MECQVKNSERKKEIMRPKKRTAVLYTEMLKSATNDIHCTVYSVRLASGLKCGVHTVPVGVHIKCSYEKRWPFFSYYRVVSMTHQKFCTIGDIYPPRKQNISAHNK